MSPLNYVRLSIMMFVQFFLWGSWYVANPGYLSKVGFDAGDFAWVYSVGPIAGMISPFFVGMIADRFFATKWVLGVMHIFGAFAMCAAAYTSAMELPVALEPYRPDIVNLFFFGHMLCYFPTLSLTNTLCMATMTNPEKQFPLIRVFGTIGWIAGNMILDVPQLHLAGSVNMLYLAAGSGIVLGIYSFTLPHTPPPSAGKAVSAREILGLDALVLLKRPAYLAFMVSSFLICIPLAFYYQLAFRTVDQAGFAAPASVMSLGQWSEIFFMLVMPLFFARLGVKWMLFVGMLAWVTRYGLFTLGAPYPSELWMVLVGVVLHGICYDFFFVTGQIYTDKVAPNEIRGQAQGMLVLFTLGIGMLIGAQVAGLIDKYNTPPETAKLSAEAGFAGDAITATDKELAKFKKEATQAEKETQESAIVAYFKKLFSRETEKPEQAEFKKHLLDETAPETEAVKEATEALAELKKDAKPDSSAVEQAEAKLKELRQAKVDKLISLADERAKADGATLADATLLEKRKELLAGFQRGVSVDAQRAVKWRNIWMFPAIFAGVIMVLFVLVFHDDTKKVETEGKPAKDV